MEWMVALALIAGAAALAAPSLAGWRVRDRVDASARALLASLAYARGEAVRLGARVTVCRGDSPVGCGAASARCPGGDADWSCGWVVVSGSAERPLVLRRFAGDAQVVVKGAGSELAFTPPAGQVIGGFRRFEFAPRAAASGFDGERWRRCVRIAAGGRARVTPRACGAQG